MLLAASVLVVACSSGDDSGSDDGSGGGSGGGDADDAPEIDSTATTQPPADPDDPEVVRPYIDDLISRYEDAVVAITGDLPALADDEQPLIDYVDLFEPNSEEAETIADGWRTDAEAGVRFEPFEPGQPVYATQVDGEVRATSESGDEVRFPTCETHQYRHLDASGAVVAEVEPVVRQGTATAVRVDGVWRLRQVELSANAFGCTTRSAGTPETDTTGTTAAGGDG